MKKTIIAMTAALALSSQARAQLVINEIMQSNIDCVMDDLNEFPDSWVEVYNSGETAVNLSNYKLGITDKAIEAWPLPNQTLKAGDYALIYCDKAAQDLHTDFRLESGKGCNVYLFKGNDVADKLTGLKKQPAPNIAYGRKTEGSDDWGYQETPTPKAKNCGKTCKDILGEPIFSIAGYVASNSPRNPLQLTVPEGSPEGTEIRYTTDGSEPTKNSPLYEKSITIKNTTVIRAKLFCDGYLSPRSTTQSYIYLGRSMTLPVISIVTDNKYFYDNKIGIYVDGTYKPGEKNYKFDWRRPINIEMYETDGTTCALNQLCETRIQGGATRDNQIKSLAIYANKRFGEKRFSYEMFPDQRPGQKDYKSLLIRNAGNDFNGLYMRDAIIQRTMVSHGIDLDWQAWRPAVIYINGKYVGMENIRERSNEDNIYTNYDGLEDIDMFENWWDLKAGDWENYNAFKEFYTEKDHTWAEYEKWMDVEEFLNLMITNLFYCNLDFPGNNIVMWRPKTEDGRWRWIMKDTDFGLGLYGRPVSYNTIKWIYDNNYDHSNNWANQADHTRLFRRLMDDKDFNREFIDRCAIYMGDFMNERGTRERWDEMYNLIKDEYKVHHDNLNPWWPDYNSELNSARTWIRKRPDEFYKILKDYYKLGTQTELTINKNTAEVDTTGVEVTMNGVKLTRPVFDGKFFQNRALKLSATKDGQPVAGWLIKKTESNNTVTTETHLGADYEFVMPACKKLTITVLRDAADGIQTVGTNGEGESMSIYDMRGIKVSVMKPGQHYIVKQGGKTKKI